MKARQLVERLVRPAVLQARSYHVPDSTGLIKMDAMENPYPWPEALRPAWLDAIRDVEFNRYPDPGARELKQRLIRVFGIPGNCALLIGNGSDEIIQTIALALARPGAALLAPDPGFAMYGAIAMAAGLDFIPVPLKEPGFALDEQAMLAAIAERQPALIFIASPNNPTGNLFDPAAVERIIQAAPGLVVIDEAYHAYAGHSFMPLLARCENLLIMRTLSKLGLAGLRLGFVAGPSCWLDEFEKLRLPYNIGVLAQKSAVFFLDHVQVLTEQVQQLRAERARLAARLAALPGITAWDSAANFILFRVTEPSAGETLEKLRGQGILVKSFDGMHPALRGCLRVTVGSPAENRAFLQALEGITGRAPAPADRP